MTIPMMFLLIKSRKSVRLEEEEEAANFEFRNFRSLQTHNNNNNNNRSKQKKTATTSRRALLTSLISHGRI